MPGLQTQLFEQPRHQHFLGVGRPDLPVERSPVAEVLGDSQVVHVVAQPLQGRGSAQGTADIDVSARGILGALLSETVDRVPRIEKNAIVIHRSTRTIRVCDALPSQASANDRVITEVDG